ncbi:MAG: QueT transporter family protein [Eubacteriaceae bacterium]|nr:QueT transporter family protein [Eubacteriaceae bacterium]
MNKKIKYIIKSSLIAAIYFILSLIFVPTSYSLMQIRISECLSVLAYFTPAAIPGLALGCLIQTFQVRLDLSIL